MNGTERTQPLAPEVQATRGRDKSGPAPPANFCVEAKTNYPLLTPYPTLCEPPRLHYYGSRFKVGDQIGRQTPSYSRDPARV